MSGILLLDKPSGISSNDALQAAKRIFHARKAGHTGNLDLQAEGLLPVCFGQATKLCAYLLDADKYYRSEFTLGTATTTGDCEGEISFRGSLENVDLPRIERAIAGFIGEIDQLPPMHSAIKRHGVPLYKLAHRGIEVARDVRKVSVYRFEVRYFHNDVLGVDIHCSKGTYVRTLAADLGQALNCGAHVSSLRRLKVGGFDVCDARSLSELEACAASGYATLDKLLLPMDGALASTPKISLTDDAVFYMQRGQAVLVPRAPTGGLVRLYGPGRQFIGVGEVQDDGRIAPRRLIRTAV